MRNISFLHTKNTSNKYASDSSGKLSHVASRYIHFSYSYLYSFRGEGHGLYSALVPEVTTYHAIYPGSPTVLVGLPGILS